MENEVRKRLEEFSVINIRKIIRLHNLQSHIVMTQLKPGLIDSIVRHFNPEIKNNSIELKTMSNIPLSAPLTRGAKKVRREKGAEEESGTPQMEKKTINKIIKTGKDKATLRKEKEKIKMDKEKMKMDIEKDKAKIKMDKKAIRDKKEMDKKKEKEVERAKDTRTAEEKKKDKFAPLKKFVEEEKIRKVERARLKAEEEVRNKEKEIADEKKELEDAEEDAFKKFAVNSIVGNPTFEELMKPKFEKQMKMLRKNFNAVNKIKNDTDANVESYKAERYRDEILVYKGSLNKIPYTPDGASGEVMPGIRVWGSYYTEKAYVQIGNEFYAINKLIFEKFYGKAEEERERKERQRGYSTGGMRVKKRFLVDVNEVITPPELLDEKFTLVNAETGEKISILSPKEAETALKNYLNDKDPKAKKDRVDRERLEAEAEKERKRLELEAEAEKERKRLENKKKAEEEEDSDEDDIFAMIKRRNEMNEKKR